MRAHGPIGGVDLLDDADDDLALVGEPDGAAQGRAWIDLLVADIGFGFIANSSTRCLKIVGIVTRYFNSRMALPGSIAS